MQHRTNENISPKVFNLVQRHLVAVQQEKLDGIQLHLNCDDPEDPLDIQALILGPTQTPYEGGTYRVKICVGAEFPALPPRAIFMTKIFHPNINPSTGDVCVNTLKRDWDPANWSIAHVLQVIRCLLIVPFPESALNEEAGRLFMESYAEYANTASIFTRVHAMPQRSLGDGGAALGAFGAAAGGALASDGAAAAEDEEERRKKALKQAKKGQKTLRRL
jgi:ubiquitin-conjugating enzyme E2 S